MKRKLTCLTAIILTTLSLQAQETVYDANGRQDPSDIWVNKVNDNQEWRDENRWHDPFDIYAGPVLGVVASNLTEYDGKYMFAPYIGGVIQAYFNNHIGMSLDFAYTRQGVRDAWANFLTQEQMEEEHLSPGPYEYRLDYINTTYKIHYYPIRNFNVFAGFLFGVHFRAKCELDGVDTNIRKHLHKRMAHVIGGIGYELDNLSFQAYYGYPLSKLAGSSTGRKALHNAREHVILLTVGYRFKVY